MPTFSPIRAALVFTAIGCMFVALLGRVAYLQTIGRQHTIRRAERQQHMTQTLPSRRGTVFDTNGNILAATVQTQTLFADPKFLYESFQEDGHTLIQLDDQIAKLAKLLEKNPFELSKLLSEKSDTRFVRIAEKVDDPTIKAIEQLDLPGIGFVPTNARVYPMGSIAAHVLGGVGRDCAGLEGIELRYEKTLAGKDGFKRSLKDSRRRGFAVAADDYLPPQHGKHLILTIDSTIQMITEEELKTTCEDPNFLPKRGEVIVMNPKTGEILALANWPTFNPQNLEDSQQKTRLNRCLTDPYEPGSTNKPFIAGPALMWHITHADEVFPTGGASYRTPYGRLVQDVHNGYPKLAFWDVLVKSSNIGMSMLAERMGNPAVYKALYSFGYGRRTGIELPGEDPGLSHPLNKWTKYSTESVAQGYEVMVTPLQIARAFSVYANGGKLVQPHVIKGVLDPNGTVIENTKPPTLDRLPEIIDPSTCAQMRRILADVPIRGTASGNNQAARKLCPDYNFFGKTGTAHISEGKSGYSQTKYTSSFIGAGPYEDPRIVVVFIVHEVEKKETHNYYGGAASAPGAARIFNRVLTYLRTPPSPEIAPPPPQIADVLWNFNAKDYRKPVVAAPPVALTN